MSRRYWLTAVSLGCVLLLDGCGIVGMDCTDEFVYGIRVLAIDAVTRQSVTSGLSGALTEGSYHEELTVFGSTLLGAGEREGTYSVAVAAAGYRVWLASDVRVFDDGCHVKPVALEAVLVIN